MPHLKHIAYCTSVYKHGAKKSASKQGPFSSSSMPLDGYSDATLYIRLGWSSKAGCHYFVVQFNPSKLVLAGATELLAIFQGFFDDGYNEFLQHACVFQYIEIPLNVAGAQFADFLFVDEAVKSVDASYEPAGTLYLGSANSSKYWSIYDKAKEMWEMKGVQLNEPLLRIEPCLLPQRAVHAVAESSNPYSSLHVIERSRLANEKDNVLLKRFRQRVEQESMTAQQAYGSVRKR